MNEPTVKFSADAVHFYDYPYPPASVYPSGKIAYERILEVDPASREIRTLDREILFIAAAQSDNLQKAAVEHRLPVVRRLDVWSLILEPFLDTEHSAQEQERTLQILEECGVSRGEVEEWRSSLGSCMYKYNFGSGLWEWCHLGLTDVLDMRLGKLAGYLCRLSTNAYREFYLQAMETAFRGKPI